jgi:rhodanese-related sulfurtransferase
MLETLRKTIADSIRMWATSNGGAGAAPVRMAKRAAGSFADRIYPPESRRDFATPAASATQVTPAAAHVGAARGHGGDEGVGLAAQARAAASTASKPGTPALLDMEAGQLRAEIDAGGEYLIVDVREPAETMHGIIPGALLVPMAQVLSRIAEVRDQPMPVVVYCASGSRSRQVAQALRDRGIARAFNLKGGIGAWHSAGGDIEAPGAKR